MVRTFLRDGFIDRCILCACACQETMEDLDLCDTTLAEVTNPETQWINILANMKERQSTPAATEATAADVTPCTRGVDESAVNELSHKGESLAKSSDLKKDTFKGNMNHLTVAPRRLETLQKLCTGNSGVAGLGFVKGMKVTFGDVKTRIAELDEMQGSWSVDGDMNQAQRKRSVERKCPFFVRTTAGADDSEDQVMFCRCPFHVKVSKVEGCRRQQGGGVKRNWAAEDEYLSAGGGYMSSASSASEFVAPVATKKSKTKSERYAHPAAESLLELKGQGDAVVLDAEVIHTCRPGVLKRVGENLIDEAGRSCKFKRTAYSGEHFKAILRPLVHSGVVPLEAKTASKCAAVEISQYVRDGHGQEATKAVHEIATRAIHSLREEMSIADKMTVPFAQVRGNRTPPYHSYCFRSYRSRACTRGRDLGLVSIVSRVKSRTTGIRPSLARARSPRRNPHRHGDRVLVATAAQSEGVSSRRAKVARYQRHVRHAGASSHI